jgi:hypothetical protein
MAATCGALLNAYSAKNRDSRAKRRQNAFDLALRWDSSEMVAVRGKAWSTFVEPDPQPNYWIDTLDAEARSSVLRVLRFFRLITSAYKADIVDHGMAKELFGVSYSRWVDRFMKPQLQLFDLAMLDESNYRVDDKYLFVPSDWLSKP